MNEDGAIMMDDRFQAYYERHKIKGEDQWGQFYDMTGHEAKGFCFWCGKRSGKPNAFIPIFHKRYCNDECRNNYYKHFIWKYASAWCLERAGYKCEKCGIKPLKQPIRQEVTTAEVGELLSEYPKMLWSRAYTAIDKEYRSKYDYETKKYKDSQLEAHHIDPLKGDRRYINKKNHPKNLICLCSRCHSHINRKVTDEPKTQMILF